MNKTSIWLDLEETVINNWHDGCMAWTAQSVKAWLKKTTNDPRVNIFSYAIWDKNDVLDFQERLRPMLEQELEILVEKSPCIMDVMFDVKKMDHFEYSNLHEFMQINTKWLGFMKYIMASPGTDNTHFYLIDDVVPDMTVQLYGRNSVIDFINVMSL